MNNQFTHLDSQGNAQMVDISDKQPSHRFARARGRIFMKQSTLRLVQSHSAKKGDVLGVARLAAIMATKKTSDLIPLCHPLMISKVHVDFSLNYRQTCVDIKVSVKTTAQTGVEMEALTAVSVAALTVYDMLKAVDKNMRISDIRVVVKKGGQSGDYEAYR